ncbi:hypothetical protein [Maritimibacter sp. UBA3975]|uniref:hypothetical protein n=1 Tax=Maritimibacter sp. UBA3975 TaxID=1946833 RepID=UPI000C0BA017|nr:hypothetical protein [Maritimibacter sp. UBA3975]MAM61659.1 hypothetical protein [Maritimibacter sp.]|tara:strand:+ start:411 stop:635 length:225 start_codon:yes stop_codon:yes gene_type:complete
MFAATRTRPAVFLTRLFTARPTAKAPRKGPMPSWTRDPELAAKLLHDTGLQPEDLGIAPKPDITLPFFMQHDYR